MQLLHKECKCLMCEALLTWSASSLLLLPAPQREGLSECYLAVVESFMQSFSILSRYGGTFFLDWQHEHQLSSDLLNDYHWPFERMKEYQELIEVSIIQLL